MFMYVDSVQHMIVRQFTSYSQGFGFHCYLSLALDTVSIKGAQSAFRKTRISNMFDSQLSRYMSMAYQVRQLEPLAVEDVKVVYWLRGLFADAKQDDDCDVDEENDDMDPEKRYVKSMHATITGRETASGKRIAIGHMKAVFVKVNMARHRKLVHDLGKSFE
jgi:hypothetical protein